MDLQRAKRLQRTISSPELRRGDLPKEKPRLRRSSSSPDLHRGPRLANEGAHSLSTTPTPTCGGSSSLEASYDLFMSPAPPPFLIDRRTIVLALACCGGVWSCYALDLGTNTVSAMDPSGRRPLPYARALGHADVARRMVEHAIHCARRASGDPQLGRGAWKLKLVPGQGNNTSIFDSGFQVLSCMRWYTGSGRSVVSPGHPPEQARRDLVLQILLSMGCNLNGFPTMVMLEHHLGCCCCRRNTKDADAAVGRKRPRSDSDTVSSGSSSRDARITMQEWRL